MKIEMDTSLVRGCIINISIGNIILQIPISNSGLVEDHQIVYNDYGVVIQDKENFYTQEEYWNKIINCEVI